MDQGPAKSVIQLFIGIDRLLSRLNVDSSTFMSAYVFAASIYYESFANNYSNIMLTALSCAQAINEIKKTW